jgi:hypothetical protein
MASALEFSKFVVAAFLHRSWKQLGYLYKTYMLLAVIVLSGITSMGIFGFLSDAYQASAVDLSANQIQIESTQAELARTTEELNRINRSLDEIPNTRVTKKMQAHKDVEPMIQQLNHKSEDLANQLKQLDLKNLDVKMKVGPLVYVAKAFKQDIDTVVKWLILVFVGVFDPLAICLVIAASEALKTTQEKSETTQKTTTAMTAVTTVPTQEISPLLRKNPPSEVLAQAVAEMKATAQATNHTHTHTPTVTSALHATAQEILPVAPTSENAIQMRFVDESPREKS